MKSIKKLCYVAIFLLLSIWWGGPAEAIPIPMAEILYVEKQIDSDSWLYDFTFNNPKEAPDDFLHLFGVRLEFQNPGVGVEWIGTPPVGWAVRTPDPDNLPVDNVLDIFTETGGQGIAPDSSLSGFSFQFNQQIGNSPFVAFFADPNGGLFTPVIESYGTTAPVPEPATILLVATGAMGLGLFRRKKVNNRL